MGSDTESDTETASTEGNIDSDSDYDLESDMSTESDRIDWENYPVPQSMDEVRSQLLCHLECRDDSRGWVDIRGYLSSSRTSGGVLFSSRFPVHSGVGSGISALWSRIASSALALKKTSSSDMDLEVELSSSSSSVE